MKISNNQTLFQKNSKWDWNSDQKCRQVLLIFFLFLSIYSFAGYPVSSKDIGRISGQISIWYNPSKMFLCIPFSAYIRGWIRQLWKNLSLQLIIKPRRYFLADVFVREVVKNVHENIPTCCTPRLSQRRARIRFVPRIYTRFKQNLRWKAWPPRNECPAERGPHDLVPPPYPGRVQQGEGHNPGTE